MERSLAVTSADFGFMDVTRFVPYPLEVRAGSALGQVGIMGYCLAHASSRDRHTVEIFVVHQIRFQFYEVELQLIRNFDLS